MKLFRLRHTFDVIHDRLDGFERNSDPSCDLMLVIQISCLFDLLHDLGLLTNMSFCRSACRNN